MRNRRLTSTLARLTTSVTDVYYAPWALGREEMARQAAEWLWRQQGNAAGAVGRAPHSCIRPVGGTGSVLCCWACCRRVGRCRDSDHTRELLASTRHTEERRRSRTVQPH